MSGRQLSAALFFARSLPLANFSAPCFLVSRLHRRYRSTTSEPPFEKILVANRGEIACRVFRTAKRMGIKTVAIYSEADKYAIHTYLADEAVCVGPAATSESYLKIDNVLEAIKSTGAQAVHPGYGFLSENYHFVKALDDAGVTFIGPGTEAMSAMGDKIRSKQIAKDAGVNIIPGFIGEVDEHDQILKICHEIGYPVMLKASAGGGGKGMRIAWNDEQAIEGFRLSKEEAKSFFGDDRMLIEKFIDKPRHIEIQVLADKFGNVVYLNERECSIQRRNQKVVEEAPSPFLTPEVRKAMGEQACALARAVNYCSAGTVEMLVDSQRNFYFLEMNTRLQVEHPISEMITQQDIVEHMIRVAAGDKLSVTQEQIGIHGHAIECRIYAEDPFRNFLPAIGRLTAYREPTSENNVGTVRVDAGVLDGTEISMFYDPLISKLVTHGQDRAQAIEATRQALDSYIIRGVTNNISFCRAVMDNPKFQEGDLSTNFIPEQYAGGFNGIDLAVMNNKHKLVSAAGYIHASLLRKAQSISDLDYDIFDSEFVVTLQDESFVIRLGDGVDEIQAEGSDTSSKINTIVGFFDEAQGMYEFTFEDQHPETLVVQLVSRENIRYKLQFKGTQFDCTVKTPRQHALMKHMIPEQEIDTYNALLSPMPGRVVSVDVSPGDKVVIGQELVVVEAMKMQNLLRSERNGIVKSVKAQVGSSVAVDEVILEFEPEASQ